MESKQKWKNSNKIDPGINLVMSNYMDISYPHLSLKKLQLPKIEANWNPAGLETKNHQKGFIEMMDKRVASKSQVRREDSKNAGNLIGKEWTKKKDQRIQEKIDTDSLDDLHDLKWISLQQQTLSKMVIDLLNSETSNGDAEERRITVFIENEFRQLPLEILSKSTSLLHIYNSSIKYNFLESFNGITIGNISLKSFDFIVEYLNRTFLLQRNKDISMFRKYEIPPKILFEILENSIYFDLPNLVDFCTISLSKQFHRKSMANPRSSFISRFTISNNKKSIKNGKYWRFDYC
jgi:hypothetical protein